MLKPTKTLGPEGFDAKSDAAAVAAALRLVDVAKLVTKAKRSGGIVRWSDDPGGLIIDPIPNPKKYLEIGVSPIAIKFDFGRAGYGVVPPT